jgi:hypothetical protein
MLKNFTKYAGVVQTLIGLGSQFVPSIGPMLGAEATGGNIFNILSGAALSYLGFKGSDSAQRTGAQAIGGLNGLVGLLGFIKPDLLAGLGLNLNSGTLSNIINLAIAAWGLYAGFAKKPAGATAH